MATGEKKQNLSVAARVTLVCALLFTVTVVPCYGQSLGSGLVSAFPLNSLERYIGPLLPRNGIGATFRSEICAGPGLGALQDVRLSGTDWAERQLQGWLALDEYPMRYDINSNLRFWRFGLLLGYSFFETIGHRGDPDGPGGTPARTGKVDISGFRLGGSCDVVQLTWLTAGVEAEHYFFEPGFSGDLDLEDNTAGRLIVKGAQPTTVRPYLRYVPPDILGFPVHFEAFYGIPVSGAKLTSWGATLAFRPQIYRFDVAAKLTFARKHLGFETAPEFADSDFTSDRWTMDMQWNMYGLELALYF